jgi:hypothetical protein
VVGAVDVERSGALMVVVEAVGEEEAATSGPST